MREEDLAREYLNGHMDRRTLMRGLVAAGLTGVGAAAFAGAIARPRTPSATGRARDGFTGRQRDRRTDALI